MNYVIACEHPYGSPEHLPRHEDYHPLSEEAVGFLLRIAQLSSNANEITSIQCRLAQGIVGMTCPMPAEGPVAGAYAKINKIFVEEFPFIHIHVIAMRIHELMETV